MYYMLWNKRRNILELLQKPLDFVMMESEVQTYNLFLCFRTHSCSTVFRNHKYTLHIIFSVLQINIIGNLFSCKY